MVFGLTFWSFGLGLTFVVALGLFIYWLVITFKEKEKPEDYPFLFNLMPYRSNGYAIGLIKEIKRGPSGRTRIFYDPKDLRAEDIVKKNWKTQDVIIDFDHIITIPKGIISNYKNIIIALPPNAEDMPNYFKNSLLGEIFSEYLEKINTDNTIIKAMREESNRKDALLVDIGGGEISDTWRKWATGILQDFGKNIASDVKKKDSSSGASSYNRPHEV